MKDILVSVIVPIYNVEKYIDRALVSLEKQTLKEIEIILVDDGSKDNSGKIADEYAAKHENWQCIHQENKGLSGARNTGLEVAKGKYVSFIDPDDYIEPNMIEDMFVKIEAEKSDLVICGHFEEFTSHTNTELPCCDEKIIVGDELVSFIAGGKLPAYACNKMFSNELIKEHKLRFAEGIVVTEDVIFLCSFLRKAQHCSFLSEPLYHYIRNSNSICASYYEKQYDFYKAGYAAIDELIADKASPEKTQVLLIENQKRFANMAINMLDRIFSIGNRECFSKKRKKLYEVINDQRFLDSVEYMDSSEKRKLKLIKSKKYFSLSLYEWWKMRVWFRIKYYGDGVLEKLKLK